MEAKKIENKDQSGTIIQNTQADIKRYGFLSFCEQFRKNFIKNREPNRKNQSKDEKKNLKNLTHSLSNPKPPNILEN